MGDYYEDENQGTFIDLDEKPALQSSTVRAGLYEVGNGLTALFGNALGISQVIGLANGLISIFSGIQTISGRVKARKRIRW